MLVLSGEATFFCNTRISQTSTIPNEISKNLMQMQNKLKIKDINPKTPKSPKRVVIYKKYCYLNITLEVTTILI